MSGCLSLASGCRLLLLFVACTTLLVSAAGTTCSELPVEDLGQFSKRGCCTTENATVGPLADASGLTVPRLGAVLEKLGASKLVLIGDSLMEQVFDSLSVQIALQSDVLAPSYYCKLTKDTSRADNVADCGACPCGLQRVDCAAGIVSGCKTVIALPGGGQIVLIRTCASIY